MRKKEATATERMRKKKAMERTERMREKQIFGGERKN